MVDRVVFDVELAQAEPLRQPIAAHERRKSRIEAGQRLARNGQQLAVPPEILGPLLDLLPRHRDRGVVVHWLEWTQALVADVHGLGRERGLTQMTLESDERVQAWPNGWGQRSLLISPSPAAKAGIGT